MKGYSYIDCATDELIRSAIEEEYFLDQRIRHDSIRFRERSPSEVVYKIGPADSALPYPFLLTLFVEGRLVVTGEGEIGWQHQGLEKSMEHASWIEAGELLKRINSNENSSLRLAYFIAVEKLFGHSEKISLYERLLRIAMLEAERVLHHLRIVDRICELITAAPRREPLKWALSVAKKLYSLLDDNSNEGRPNQKHLDDRIESLRHACTPAIAALRNDHQILNRLEAQSIIDRATALTFGLTGIYARAAGLDVDIRRAHSELPYSMLDFQPQCLSAGDAYSRFLLRLSDIETSLLLMSQALRLAVEPSIQSSHQATKTYRQSLEELKPNSCQVATVFLEAPEGELAITVSSDGQAMPFRVRIKTPSFSLMASLSVFLRGSDLDDVVLILNTLGINTLEVDR